MSRSFPTGRHTVRSEQQDIPLIDFVSGAWRLSRRQAKRLVDARCVFVNSRRIWMARYRLRAGDRVEVAECSPPSPAAPVAVLYDDDQLVVADKPAGLESVGKDGMEGRMQAQLACAGIVAVHRLDKQTTGCLILARQTEAKERLIEQFQDRSVIKNYRAVALGRLAMRPRTVSAPLDGKPAVTRIRVLEAQAEASYLAIRIETGRKHQIRRHLAAIHHPLLGEPQYHTGPLRSTTLRQVPRPLLHACSVQFLHPHSGEAIRVRSELPRDFRFWLDRLGLK